MHTKEVVTTHLKRPQIEDLGHEMNILSQLQHPSIVKLYSIYFTQHKLFLVRIFIFIPFSSLFEKSFSYHLQITEYLNGGELLRAIAKRKYYSEDDAKRVMTQVVLAVEYLHSRFVVHGDLKTRNLVLSNKSLESDIKIVDFGFAMVLSEQKNALSAGWLSRTFMPKTRSLRGTRGFAAPEILRGDVISSLASDVWSLGIILYILLSGKMPFNAKDTMGILEEEVTFPHQQWRFVSTEAQNLICRMLVKSPDDRLTVGEVLHHPWLKRIGWFHSRFHSYLFLPLFYFSNELFSE